ncbi:UTP--glucose-1-phosphate uridylyltransferase [Tessaracoccus bendigoensis DSM 12906]|uniref:UTP--glucose-1-phosphate uridylyltransferase n=1 Tax=Tessaracoccus bendigoensis DSM 12906 TaxID=1123357 RepID=A0A1M6BRQ1_9ACTN|nr:UTP--glucose-1-phosphate uridylyltransferase [Tessaracoccus bendigoensis]SHI51435.1 UTP--glucose-1-phosphate uridylyltransferase [Tessaracoccus bendigoensis DSM 12906]
MSVAGLEAARQKMLDAGVSAPAIEVFSRFYELLESGATGVIREDTIDPLLDPPMLADVDITDAQAREAIGKTVIIKLNGGLGTSMGLDKAKTLLKVRDGANFLDLIARQVLAARERYDARLPLLLMNSFRTEQDTLEHLAKYPELQVEGLPLSFMQNQEPKLRADDLTPVEWPADPTLEWCPPGHGDLYPALEGSGVLDQLIEHGFRYACVSNGDNLGACPNATIAGWFAQSGAPYAAELCRRTVNDKKGGHLAIRKADGQLILRDTAQTAPEEMDYFTDEFRHPFFHTNNLWFDLVALRKALTERNSVLGLPLIRNEKTVDPGDSSSTPVIQVESAMGAAIEVFEGATAICVGRDRFLPVKTTNELLLLRSDVYSLTAEGKLIATTDSTPEISLDSKYFKLVDDFNHRIPTALSLRKATSFKVKGDWTFEPGVVVRGAVELADEGVPTTVPAGTRLGD